MKILGISAFYHDSAAALIDGETIVAAAQEERFTRKKHDAEFPRHSIQYCLQAANLKLYELDAVVFYDKPFLKFERLLETYFAFAPKGFSSFRKAMPLWLKEKLFQKKRILDELHGIDENFVSSKLLFSEHHVSHAASAFFPSGFEEALVLTLDGVGEWTTTSAAIGKDSSLKVLKEIYFPHSLGLLYSAFTYYCGFKVNSGEYKLMGLAPYGKPLYAQKILERLIDLKKDGSFHLNQEYFDYATGLTMTNKKFAALFGGAPRTAEDPLTERHMDLAASVQWVTEEVLLRIVKSLAAETKQKNLCLAGGVALNCVANGRILREGIFEKIWVQPAAGDAGGALGAALAAYHLHFKKPRTLKRETMQGAYLGPEFGTKEIASRLEKAGAKFRVFSEDEGLKIATTALLNGKVVAWFQGRMEFGPRALGARSILADPRSPTMQTALNLKVKHRESFRPFAPSILREDLSEWFAVDVDSPYMLLVAQLRKKHWLPVAAGTEKLFGIDQLNVLRSLVPAITHVDYSARLQTVHQQTNPKYYRLLQLFKEQSGCPMLVNTSFNVRGEPIVCTPEDAFRCFMGTDLDAMLIGDCYLEKIEQDEQLRTAHHKTFALD